MEAANDQLGKSPTGPEDSFFIHGMTVAPGEASPGSLPLPAPTDEFTFVRQIGHGGMGIVYEAIDRASRRRVAVKIIAPGMRVGIEGFERFKREARAAAAVSHPSCVFVFGAHDVHGTPAISMELMPGETVDDRLRGEEPLPSAEALRWTLDVLAGLEAVHERGLVHRDVKPANLFVTGDDRVKLGDFGLSRSFEGELGLTRTGIFLGSPLFASPEQVRGRELDPRSDVYSAGATLFCLLTGRAPFTSTSIGDLFARIATEEPPRPRELVASIPRGLDAIVRKAMAKDPSQRFQTAAEMRRALARFSPESVEPAPLGVRFAAGVLDHFILQIGYLLLIAAAIQSGLAESWRRPVVVEVAWTVLMVFWYALWEWRRGATPGKRAFGLRVADVAGGHPSFGASLLRGLIFFLPRLVVAPWDLVVPLYALQLMPLATAGVTRGRRGIHELASGTRTLRVRPALAGVLRSRPWDPAREPVEEPTAIASWTLERRVAKTALGELFVARDPRLQRQVWVHRLHDESSALDPAARSREEDIRLCWLAGGPGYDVFSEPGGASVEEYGRGRRRLDWNPVRDAILRTIEESEIEGRAIAVSRLWIDRRGCLRVLDFDLAPKRVPAPDPVSGLGDLTRALLFPAPNVDLAPTLVPDGGRRLLGKLAGQRSPFADLAAVKAAMASLGDTATPVGRGLRANQIALAALGRVILFVAVIAAIAYALDIGEVVLDDETLTGEDASRRGPLAYLVAAFIAGMVLPQTFLAWLARGGPVFSLLHLRLIDESGERASRARCAWRTFLSLAPVTLMLIGASAAAFADAGATATAFLVAAPCTAAVQLVFALISPSRGLSDAAAGTRIVH